MPDSGSYWDDPGVKAAEAAYEEAKKEAAAAKDDRIRIGAALRAYKALHVAIAAWYARHPDEWAKHMLADKGRANPFHIKT